MTIKAGKRNLCRELIPLSCSHPGVEPHALPWHAKTIRSLCGAMFIIFTGVAGAGKTTVGKLLAKELGWRFYDADDFHPAANVEKMRRGEPLTDEDRQPWLDALRALIETGLQHGENGVLACSALKRSYRARLRVSQEVVFVHLVVTTEVIERRLKQRKGHFINPSLAPSQFATLETPKNALRVDASLPPRVLVQQVRRFLAV